MGQITSTPRETCDHCSVSIVQIMGEATRAAVTARHFCGSETEAIADIGADHALTFTAQQRSEIAEAAEAVWREAQLRAGARATWMRT